MTATDTNARLLNDTVRAMALVLDLDGDHKLNHAWRTAALAYRVAQELGHPDPGLLHLAGLLHDIGGVGAADHVIHHAALQPPDLVALDHVREGGAILRPFTPFARLVPIVLDHHERYDGRGYPEGKHGDQIADGAAIVHVADLLELALRASAPGTRPARARVTVDLADNTACDHRIAAAARRVVSDEALLATLYDDEDALAALVRQTDYAPADIAAMPLVDLLSQLLWLFARIIDTKHPYTLGHSIRVACYALRVAEGLGPAVNPWDVVWAGLLHDVGKVGVPREVLDKDGTLSPAERQRIERHAQDTADIVATITYLAPLAYPAAAHHERYAGGGYPRGLAGEEIPLIGRILAFCDVYDALVSDRAYRRGLPHDGAMEVLHGSVGTHLDPHLAPVAMEVLEGLGRGTTALPVTFADFRRFLHGDSADVTRLLGSGRARTTEARPLGRGVLLLQLEGWNVLRLDDELRPTAGEEALAEILASPQLGSLPEYLDRPSGETLREMAAGLTDGSACTRYLFGRAGRPLEVVLLRRRHGYELLYRTAENRLQSLRTLALFYRNFLASSDAVCFTDPEGRILDVNRAFLDLYGYRLPEVIGRTPRLLRSGRQPRELYAQLWRALRDPAVGAWSGELVNRARDGSEIPVLLAITSVRDASGELAGFIGRTVDLSARRRMEEELRRKNEELERVDALKNDLLAITSHDLRSPLNGIVSYAELLRERVGALPPERAAHYLDRIVQSAHKLLELTSDLLDLERMRTGSLELRRQVCAVADVLRASLELNRPLAEQRGVALVLRAGADLPPIVVDPRRLEQVCNNLLANAIRFSPRGGRVELTAAVEERGVTIQVSDEGPGIPDGELERVFERFVSLPRPTTSSSRPSGVGLGLAIVKRLVELHGGSVAAENRATGGSCFSVILPSSVAQPAAATAPALAPALRVLLLDASGSLGRVIEPTAAARGARCVTATDLAAARAADSEAAARLIVVHHALVPAALDWLEQVRLQPGRRTLQVVVRPHDLPPEGTFDRTLETPVLEVEVLALLREAELAGAAEAAA